VFAGGWTLEAAEAVGQGGDIASEDVLDLLARLVEKSLVRMDADSGRYGMLETVKAYAREKLEASGELDGAVERHLQFFVGFARQANLKLKGPEQREWMQRVDVEHDNFQAAHAACAQRPDRAMDGLAIVRSLKYYWIASGRLAVGVRIAQEALENPGSAAPCFERAAGLRDAGMLCHFMGRYAQAANLLNESIDLARRIGEKRVLPTALHFASIVSLSENRTDDALRYCEEGVKVAQSLGSEHLLAAVLNTRGQVFRFDGDLDAARNVITQALSLVERIGDDQGATNALLNLSMIDIESGRLDSAVIRLKLAAERCERLGSPTLIQCLFDACGALLIVRGEVALGLRLIAGADNLEVQTGNRRDATDRRFVDRALAQAGCPAPIERRTDLENLMLLVKRAVSR
jgi:tetratricopeptide (TPR) repeat protein